MLLAILWTLIEPRLFSVDGSIMKLEPYSGLSPELFQVYKDKLYQFRSNLFANPAVAKIHLNGAIEAARDMALCTRTADSTIQDEVQDVIESVRGDLFKRLPPT